MVASHVNHLTPPWSEKDTAPTTFSLSKYSCNKRIYMDLILLLTILHVKIYEYLILTYITPYMKPICIIQKCSNIATKVHSWLAEAMQKLVANPILASELNRPLSFWSSSRSDRSGHSLSSGRTISWRSNDACCLSAMPSLIAAFM